MRQVLYVAITFLSVFIAGFFVFKPTSSGSLPRDLPWFELTTPTKVPFTKKDLQGHWTLMYFGYTNCPDLCPVSLQLAKGVITELEKNGPNVDGLQVVFVSVDPDRDTPKIAEDYAKFFHPDFIGLTAHYAQQQNILGSLDTVTNNDRKGGDLKYRVFHPTSFYIFNKKGQWAAEVEDPSTTQQVIDSLMKVVMAPREPS